MPLKSEAIFNKMAPHIEKHGAAMVAKVGAVYCFELREKKGAKPVVFTIDLKNGNGAIKEGKIEGVKADATFVMLDNDFIALSQGKLKPQEAFMQVSKHIYHL
tara:strand:- start:228 stop:536 length:309 start_codon:yes stop_codon:yes gene_type:complete